MALTDELAREQTATAGIRTICGSPIYADFVPIEETLIIARLMFAGAVQVGKTSVPVYVTEPDWFPISAQGSMPRTVRDTALMLSVLAGPDPRVPISLNESRVSFRASLERDFSGSKMVWSRDLGSFPVDDAVSRAIEPQVAAFSAVGCSLEGAHPAFHDADFCFKTLRAWAFESRSPLLREEHHDKIKETIIWNVEAGQRQS